MGRISTLFVANQEQRIALYRRGGIGGAMKLGSEME
jgi:hypothetical protein